jgi:protein SCO1/2
LLGEAMDDRVRFISITIDPNNDTPVQLRDYRARHTDQDWTGWLHLTGTDEEIEGLRWRLGVYDLDPEVDADVTQHAGVVTFGNDRTNWWAAVPALLDPHEVTDAIVRIAGNPVGRPR